jgi:Skp family chaperone for outer membrane proteins
MRMRTGVFLAGLSALLVLSLGYGTTAQQSQVQPLSRVGVMGVMKIIENSKKNADHIAQSQAEQKKRIEELRTLDRELVLEKDQLKTFLPGTDDYLEQAKLVGSKQVNLEALQNYYTQKYRSEERDWMEQLYKDILAAAQRIAEAKDLGMVFERSEPEYPIPAEQLIVTIKTHKLIYSKGCIDISDEVLAEIDK